MECRSTATPKFRTAHDFQEIYCKHTVSKHVAKAKRRAVGGLQSTRTQQTKKTHARHVQTRSQTTSHKHTRNPENRFRSPSTFHSLHNLSREKSIGGQGGAVIHQWIFMDNPPTNNLPTISDETTSRQQFSIKPTTSFQTTISKHISYRTAPIIMDCI